MNKDILKGSGALLIAALIWGMAFSAQKTGMRSLSPEWFTCLRSIIGFLVLIPVIYFFSRKNNKPLIPREPGSIKTLMTGGIACGVVLAFASTTQQYGLIYSTAGKAGFITTLYIVFVPIAGVFLKHKISFLVWIAAVLALFGSYLLCSPDGSSINAGDIWLFVCALLFSIHIIVIGYFAPATDCIKMSCVQFATTACVTGFAALIKQDEITAGLLRDAAIPLLYCGICSSGIAFTLQIISQKYIAGAAASILMSMESVFGVIGGFIFLGEKLSGKELCGCGAIFAAVILAQITPASPQHTGSSETDVPAES